MRISSCLTAAIASLSLGVPTLADPPKLAIGEPFPDLTLPSLEDGSPAAISDFRGQRLILHVFASW